MDISPFPVGRQAEMRLASIVETREGKISREIAFEMWRAV